MEDAELAQRLAILEGKSAAKKAKCSMPKPDAALARKKRSSAA